MNYNSGIATPYTAVYIILRKGNKVAFVLRQNTGWMDNHYGLVSGRVEKEESFLTAAVREAQEEAGVKVRSEDLKLVLTAHRNDPDSVWVDLCFEAPRWEGKPYNAEPEIHGELAWFALDDLPDNLVPSVRFFLEQIQAGKLYAEYGWPTKAF